MPNSRPPYRASAFTLMELIVVIAIIVLLIGILLPTMARSRDTARQAICLSNQKQTGEAMFDRMVISDGLLPWITGSRPWFSPDVLVCASDLDPVKLPKEAMGTPADVPTSFGFNPEYAINRVRYENFRNPSEKMLLYDGFGGTGGSTSSGGTDGNDYFLAGNKVQVTHLPPGNLANGIVMEIGLSALSAHVGHNHADSNHIDMFGNWTSGGNNLDIVGYTQGDFVRRHVYGRGVGNVLFADGHADAYVALEHWMYMFPPGAPTSGGGGKK